MTAFEFDLRRHLPSLKWKDTLPGALVAYQPSIWVDNLRKTEIGIVTRIGYWNDPPTFEVLWSGGTREIYDNRFAGMRVPGALFLLSPAREEGSAL